jgi:hypothetical protein
MKWEYERREVTDKRLESYLAEKGEEGWELAYARRGRMTRVAQDPEYWEVILKRQKGKPAGKTLETDATKTLEMAD